VRTRYSQESKKLKQTKTWLPGMQHNSLFFMKIGLIKRHWHELICAVMIIPINFSFCISVPFSLNKHYLGDSCNFVKLIDIFMLLFYIIYFNIWTYIDSPMPFCPILKYSHLLVHMDLLSIEMVVGNGQLHLVSHHLQDISMQRWDTVRFIYFLI